MEAKSERQSTVLTRARRLRKENRLTEARHLLREALRRHELSPEDVALAGRFIASDPSPAAHPVLLLGQCTTSWLSLVVTAQSFARGIDLLILEGAYDNVVQSLDSIRTASRAPAATVLLPWNQRLLALEGSTSPSERVEGEAATWSQAWRQLRHLGSRIVQVGYDYMSPGPTGYHLASGDIATVSAANDWIRSNLPDDAYFVDLERVSGDFGRRGFYDPRRYFWTKQPFSEDGLCWLADHIVAGLRAVLTGPKKVLVLDLDNTLWGGVVGEVGPLGVELGESPDGEAFRALQRHAKGLAHRGCVLAICSKNNPADALEVFEKNPDMVLRLEDIAALEIGWEPKSVGLRRIAETLRLGLDSFVFVDDHPAEREEVRQLLPDVEVVELPADPAEYVRALEAGLWFEASTVTEADIDRAKQYTIERGRRASKEDHASIPDYLRSLQLRGTVSPITEADIGRVAQLIGKTNQFNLTTRRHSVSTIRCLVEQSRSVALVVRISDRFGDYGLIAVVIGLPHSDDRGCLVLDTWLMSCRVIGRTVEEFTANAIIQRAAELGYTALQGEYIPTTKNALVRDLYPRLGFTPESQSTVGSATYRYTIGESRCTTYVEPAKL